MIRNLAMVLVLIAMLVVAFLASGVFDADPAAPTQTSPALTVEEESDPLQAPLPVYEPPPPAERAPLDVEEDLPALPELAGVERFVLAVHVVDPDDVPVPKAVLRVERGSGEDAKEELLWVEDGRAEVERTTEDGALHLLVEDPVDARGRPLDLLSRRLDDVPLETTEVRIALPRSRRLAGTVADPSGRPVAGVAVQALPGGRASQAKAARSREDGTFEILGLPSGEVRLRIPLAEPWLLESPSPLYDEEDVQLEVVPKVALVVVILGDDGRAVPHMRLHVEWRFDANRFTQDGECDAEGRLVIEGVPATGRFLVETRGVARGVPQPNTTVADRPYGDGVLHVRLPPSVAISGIVVDTRGDPVGSVAWDLFGAEARVRSVQRSGRTTHGRFRVDHLAPGAYRLRVSSGESYAPQRAHLVTAPAEDLRIVLKPAASATGTILGENPLDVVVQWFSPSIHSSMASVKKDGTWSIPDLPDEPGTLYAWRKRTNEVFLLEGVRPADHVFDIRTQPGLPIAGRIDGLEPRPDKPHFTVLVRGPLKIPIHPGPGGVFRREGIPPGPWRLEVLDANMQTLVSGDVEAGDTDVHLRLP